MSDKEIEALSKGTLPSDNTVSAVENGEVTLYAGNQWKHTWNDLPQKSGGKNITYTVKETSNIDGYSAKVTGDVKTGFVVTNSHKPETIDIEGTKTWDDNNNQDGKRPREITVRLLANGTETATKTVTKLENWKYSFTDLPKYSDGQEIKYTITEDMKAQLADFYGNYCTEDETAKTIAEIFKDSHYVIDTHTAVAAGVYDKYVKDTNDTTPTVIASTASPYKFTRSVMEALGADTDGKDDFALADELSVLSGVKLPQAVETIRTAPVLHNRVVDAPDMPKAVKDILGIR